MGRSSRARRPRLTPCRAISYDEVREDGIHDDQRQPIRSRGSARARRLPRLDGAQATAESLQSRSCALSLTCAIPHALRLFLLCPALLCILTEFLSSPTQRIGL